MTIEQLQRNIEQVIVHVTFWTSFLFIPVVSAYWPWWKHWYGKAAIAIDILLVLVLLPAIIRFIFGINITNVDFGWFTIFVFALIPVRTTWLAITIFQIQLEAKRDRQAQRGSAELPEPPEPTECADSGKHH